MNLTSLRIIVAVALGSLSPPGFAALTGPASSVAEDAAAFHSNARAEEVEGYTVHHLVLGTGTEVREFVAHGVVFGVAWSGPFKPNLQQLLGPHFSTFVFEGSRTSYAGHTQLHAPRADVVIDAVGHPRSFQGRAYVPELVPAGVAAATVVR